MSHPSIIGNVADLQQNEILLPLFVQRKEDGLYVNLSALEMGRPFAQFAERVFAAGARFEDLDYEAFLNLVFLWEPGDIDKVLLELKRKGRPPLLRVARDIVAFPQERRDIYRSVKLDAGGGSAEYLFEPISVEREEIDATMPGALRKFTERLYPNFDEFVAALWEKGVRFGIDVKAVREAIERDQTARITIAAARLPVEGKDASIHEQTNLLRRDDTPKLLANGRMDLRHYRNRFPQVAAGTRLFKKVQRQEGRAGWNIDGKEVPPDAVNDFDLQTLAGTGTKVVRESTGEYVVSVVNGFLDIDAKSGQISIIDKIINREGVSMRTTGDLSLAGDDFEEHGEVQEKRVVEGFNMTFFADVFGNILSDGGRITIKQNVSGGSVHSPGGGVFVEGAASRSLIEARGGEIGVNQVESSMIVGDRVSIGRAVNTDIVADEVVVEQAEGCIIAARNICVKSTSSRRDEATRIIIMLPDLAPFDDQRKTFEESRAVADEKIAQRAAALQTLAAQPDMKSYAAMAPRIQAKTLVLNPAQAAQWDALLTRVAPHLRKAAALNEEMKTLREYVAGVEAELAEVAEAKLAAGRSIACRIEAIGGETQVFARRPALGETPLAALMPKPLRKRLHDLTGDAERLFSGHEGSFEWPPRTD